MKIKKSFFPKDFFVRDRKTISNKEALNDVIPMKWNEDTKETNKNISVEKDNTNSKILK